MNPLVVLLLVHRPPWYQRDLLPRSRAIETRNFGELSGHLLDEIIQEKLTNTAFEWSALASFLCLDRKTLKDMLCTWNRHKILFAKIPPNTPYTNQVIRRIAGQSLRLAERCWQRYRFFIDNGGCPLPFDPSILFRNLKPDTPFQMPAELSGWSNIGRVEVGAGGVSAG